MSTTNSPTGNAVDVNTARTVSDNAAAGSTLATACIAPGSLSSGYAIPPRNKKTRNNAFAAARFASARSVPAMKSPMPANAMVPSSNNPTAAMMPPGTLHPIATPTTTTSTTWTSSSASTVAVLAVRRPERESGVDPRRFSTP
jgi:hypothetical protein